MTQFSMGSPQRRTRAADPATPADELAKLAADANLHVRRAAAANVSTPADALTLLRRAGATDDMTSFASPDASMSEAELATVAQLGEWGSRLAARHRAASAELLHELSKHPVAAIRADAARHANVPADALRPLTTDGADEVRDAAWANPATPRGWVMTLEAVSRGEPVEADVLRELVDAGTWGRVAAARHPQTPVEQLRRFVKDRDWAVRGALAFNASSPADVLSLLGALEDVESRMALARHPNAPGELLLRILDDDTRVRIAMAKHPDPPQEVLLRLALDGRAAVREAVAKHPKMPASMVDQLARLGVGPDLMHFTDPDPTLDPDIIDALSRMGGLGAQLAARHPATPRERLTFLATDGDPVLRMTAAKHANLPAELLPLLVAAGSSEDLQGFVAPDPSLHPEQLHVLANLGPWAQRLAARHPNLPMTLIQKLAERGDQPVLRELARHPAAPAELLTQLADSEIPDVRWMVVRHPKASPEALWLLSRDAIATIRAAVAEHEATPAGVLDRLMTDVDEDVRAAVSRRVSAGADDGNTRSSDRAASDA